MGGKLLKQWPGFCFGILLGALATLLTLPNENISSKPDADLVNRRLTPRDRPKKIASGVKGSVILDKLRENPNRNEVLGETGEDGLKDSIITLLNETDPFKGFGYTSKRLFNAILEELANRDLEGTIEWVDAKLSGALREHAYVKLLEKRFGNEKPREAIDFFESRGFDKAQIADYAGRLLFSTKALRAEDATHLLRKNFSVGTSASGSNMDFAEGFDFSAFASEIMLIQSKGEGNSMRFSRFPSNLFEEWVKADPHGAMEFYSKNYLKEKPTRFSFNGIDDLAKGYLESAPPKESEAWTTAILTNPDMPLRERRKLASYLLDSSQKHIDHIVAAGASITDRKQSIDFSLMVLDTTITRSTDSYTRVLSIFPDKESRLEGIVSLVGEERYKARLLHEKSELLFRDLVELGHDAADIQRIAAALEEGK